MRMTCWTECSVEEMEVEGDFGNPVAPAWQQIHGAAWAPYPLTPQHTTPAACPAPTTMPMPPAQLVKNQSPATWRSMK